MGKPKVSFRGLDLILVQKMRDIVKKYHDGKSRGSDGSYVTEDLEVLIRLYIMTEGTICHTDAIPRKKNVIKNSLRRLAEIQGQSDIEGFDYPTVKKIVTEECVKTDRIDRRTMKNYLDVTTRLLEPHKRYFAMWHLDTIAHKTQFV